MTQTSRQWKARQACAATLRPARADPHRPRPKPAAGGQAPGGFRRYLRPVRPAGAGSPATYQAIALRRHRHALRARASDGARLDKRQLKVVRKLLRPVAPLAARLLQNRFFLLFVSLSLLGYVVGRMQLPRPAPLPYDELFDNMHVYSFRDTPSDTISHFVVELGAGGRTFEQFDVDSRR